MLCGRCLSLSSSKHGVLRLSFRPYVYTALHHLAATAGTSAFLGDSASSEAPLVCHAGPELEEKTNTTVSEVSGVTFKESDAEVGAVMLLQELLVW